ncbi:predicted protein [Streptomyces sp. SPB78]|nr:predicted protein [Streptomyces sp. SPB78]
MRLEERQSSRPEYARGRAVALCSGLLDAGENIKALSTYLGHSDPGFTLRTYTHLLPSGEARARAAMDGLYVVAA